MSRGRVLLINPAVEPASARIPLSVLNLAAVLEGQWDWQVLDGNVEPALVPTVLATLRDKEHDLVCVTAMPGPQLPWSIEVSAAIRTSFPSLPILWGGYFPTMYPNAAINAPYVDYLARGQGEATLLDLLEHLRDAGPPSPGNSAQDPTALAGIPGLSWKRDAEHVHNIDRPAISPDKFPTLPYEGLGDLSKYLAPSFLGEHTAVHQLALGCRFRCEFCGVVSMWNGKTLLGGPERLQQSMKHLQRRWGADGIMFYDNNFFDREESSLPVLDVLIDLAMPYWCFARTDTLARFPVSTSAV